MKCLSQIALWCVTCVLPFAAPAIAQSPGSSAKESVLWAGERPVIRAAIDKARESLDVFLKRAATPETGTSSYALKVAVSDGGAVEYLWVGSFAQRGEMFIGTLRDSPAIVKRYRLGERIRFARSQIVDWMFVEGSPPQVRGNFTTCAQLSEAAPEDAEEFMRQAGLQCDEPPR